MILFFDTETDGLPKRRGALPDEIDVWPRLVQIAWAVGDERGEPKLANYIIKPEGFVIPDVVANIHGISHARAMKEGVPLLDVLGAFQDDLDGLEEVSAHNIDFDYGVAGSEYIRAGFWNPLETLRRTCTMRCSTGLCRIPQKNGRGFKWPKLYELHQFLFGCGFEGAHDARNDVAAGLRCYWELKRRGVLQ